MASANGVPIISADDHLQEPADLWQKRLPAGLRERAPRLVRLEDGSDGWATPGNPTRPLGILVMAGTRNEEKKDSGVTWADVPRGSYDPTARLAAMDEDGIRTTVLYPNVCLDFFMDQFTLDPAMMAPVYAAYNDHISEFCAVAPERLIGIGLVPLDTIESGVAELRRIEKLPGLRGTLLPIIPPGGRDWNDASFEPIWATAEDLGIVISIHGGRPRGLPRRSDLAKMPGGNLIYMQLGPFSTAETFAYLFWSGVFERHPSLKIVSVEGGVGWLPYFKERGEDIIERHGGWAGSPIKYPPGYWFGKSFFATFEQDRSGLALRDQIGVDTMMWASDYPHSATTWPESQKAIAETFAGVPDAEREKITSGNAPRLYNL
jgi:predicted TIM-barrel fold metal-dependent hydrolase